MIAQCTHVLWKCQAERSLDERAGRDEQLYERKLITKNGFDHQQRLHNNHNSLVLNKRFGEFSVNCNDCNRVNLIYEQTIVIHSYNKRLKWLWTTSVILTHSILVQ